MHTGTGERGGQRGGRDRFGERERDGPDRTSGDWRSVRDRPAMNDRPERGGYRNGTRPSLSSLLRVEFRRTDAFVRVARFVQAQPPTMITGKETLSTAVAAVTGTGASLIVVAIKIAISTRSGNTRLRCSRARIVWAATAAAHEGMTTAAGRRTTTETEIEAATTMLVRGTRFASPSLRSRNV